MIHKILILGPQGSGKGTQARLLAQKLELPALSMGQLLRDEVESGSPLGKKIGKVVYTGDLVSDDIALEALKERLQKNGLGSGYVLDGYPRNLAQFQTFQGFDTPTALIVISVPTEETIKRLIKRAEIEKRKDDYDEIIRKRLMIYENATKPMIEEYRKLGVLKEVDGMGTVDEVEKRIEEALGI